MKTFNRSKINFNKPTEWYWVVKDPDKREFSASEIQSLVSSSTGARIHTVANLFDLAVLFKLTKQQADYIVLNARDLVNDTTSTMSETIETLAVIVHECNRPEIKFVINTSDYAEVIAVQELVYDTRCRGIVNWIENPTAETVTCCIRDIISTGFHIPEILQEQTRSIISPVLSSVYQPTRGTWALVGRNQTLRNSFTSTMIRINMHGKFYNTLQDLFVGLAVKDDIKNISITTTALDQNGAGSINDIIDTIKTICQYSTKPMPVINICIDHEKYPIQKIKELIKSDVHAVVLFKKLSQDERLQCFNELKCGNKWVHKAVTDMLKKPKVARSTNSLTTRQSQIYNLIKKQGSSNKSIARKLRISESAVKHHVTCILKKKGVHNRTQLVLDS